MNLQSDPTGPPPAGGPPAGAPADGPAPADGNATAAGNATAGNATAGGPPAKKGPSKAFITKVAVKFVNAMWMTMFAKVLSDGLVMRQRTTSYAAVLSTTNVATYLTPSVAYKQ